MITKKILLNNGYKEYKDYAFNASCLYQKAIKNERGEIKYFINVYEYPHQLGLTTYEVRLITEKDKYDLNINLYNIDQSMTIQEIEGEVYKMWYKLDCKFYGVEND